MHPPDANSKVMILDLISWFSPSVPVFNETLKLSLFKHIEQVSILWNELQEETKLYFFVDKTLKNYICHLWNMDKWKHKIIESLHWFIYFKNRYMENLKIFFSRKSLM